MSGDITKILGKLAKTKGINVSTLDDPESLCMVDDWVSTGCLPIDLVMGGGFPIGRITEVYGQESTGKTLLSTQAVIEAQVRDMLTVYADPEAAVSLEFMRSLGVDASKLAYYSPDTVNDLFDTLNKIIDDKNKQMGEDVPMFFVWDSVAATTTMQELDNSNLDQRQFASAAPQISRALRTMVRKLSKSKVCSVFINQQKQRLGVVFGDSDTTFGGTAINFHASIRVKLSSGQAIKQDKRRIGTWIHVDVKKNKLHIPQQSVSVPIYFGEGIYEDEALIPFGRNVGVIEMPSSGRYQMMLGGKVIKFTKRNWPDILDEHYDEVRDALTKAYKAL